MTSTEMSLALTSPVFGSIVSALPSTESVAEMVIGVLPKENKVIVENVNVQKDRQKPRGANRASGINEGGIVEKPMPIHRSNVALVDPKTGKRTRVKMKIEGENRIRVTKSGEAV